jgi:excisionase family DNA binding protein
VADDHREREIRDLLSHRQPLPFARAHWLLAELDAARIRLAAVECELEDLVANSRVAPPSAAPPDNGEMSSRWPEWLTVAEFAMAIGISRGLAYELIKRGELKRVRRFGRLVRIHCDELQVAGRRTASSAMVKDGRRSD